MSRPATRLAEIVDDLRGRILRGGYGPGDRLPTRVELQERYAASSITVQRALDALGADGFVEARGRHGTFVAAHPPHTSHYAVVFPGRPGEAGWNEFWTALHAEARAAAWRSGRRTVTPYLGVDGHADGEDWQRLLRDVRARRVAGIFFVAAPHELAGSELMAADVPRATLAPADGFPAAAQVVLDEAAFVAKALDHLAARRRRRLAALVFAAHDDGFLERIRAGAEARGMTLHERWIHGCAAAPWASRWLHGWAQLLMDRGQRERPDGLLISDDNLVEAATGGLVAAGVRVPDQLDVVAHCNFPRPTRSLVPARRLGYDAREVLARALDLLARPSRGARARHVVVAPRFADEPTDQGTSEPPRQ